MQGARVDLILAGPTLSTLTRNYAGDRITTLGQYTIK